MRTITFSDAQRRLSDLLDEVASGEVVVITRDDRPAATLSPPPALSQASVERSKKQSLLDLEPVSVGKVLRPLGPDDDLLEEMLEGKFGE